MSSPDPLTTALVDPVSVDDCAVTADDEARLRRLLATGYDEPGAAVARPRRRRTLALAGAGIAAVSLAVVFPVLGDGAGDSPLSPAPADAAEVLRAAAMVEVRAGAESTGEALLVCRPAPKDERTKEEARSDAIAATGGQRPAEADKRGAAGGDDGRDAPVASDTAATQKRLALVAKIVESGGPDWSGQAGAWSDPAWYAGWPADPQALVDHLGSMGSAAGSDGATSVAETLAGVLVVGEPPAAARGAALRALALLGDDAKVEATTVDGRRVVTVVLSDAVGLTFDRATHRLVRAQIGDAERTGSHGQLLPCSGG
ncbi:hypothetical protein [Mumia sp. DW29H23]|uniref:hypothetical protein n=1 Tax=Mumia sp. DW29H23 TaxID=3421241 RepID=UPI003D681092